MTLNSAGIEQHVVGRVAELTADWRPVMREVVLSLPRHLRDSASRRAVLASGSHVMSAIARHRRAGLPTPKTIHVALRAYAFLLLVEQGATSEQAAFWLGNSSLSGWNRVLLRLTGLTSIPFRQTYSAERWWTQVERMTRPTMVRAA